ncbi:hypothetical protein BU15DRAFT_74853 [Melanogaster broomeanus]|nr:hypothetical protein BU15DRAFT_74853 [Melanogaster broomeanus]
MTTEPVVHGWSPADGDDEDIAVSQDGYTSSNAALLSSTCPSLDTKVPPPKTCPPLSSITRQPQHILSAPLTCFPRSSMAPSSDRRAQRNRSRDPSWVPRPRNAFIIFRCEYSREHMQAAQGQDEDHIPPTLTAKTLSKRAAETWKQLPVSEKNRYKVLADREREEHARLYPNYRFRPMRRRGSGTQKLFYEHLQGSTGSVDTIIHFPSVLASAAQDDRDEARRNSPPRLKSQQGTQSSEFLSQRRSSSVPAAHPLPIPPVVPSHHRERGPNSVIERAKFVAPPWHVTATPLLEMSSYTIRSQGDLSDSPKVEHSYSISPYSSSPEFGFQYHSSSEDYEKSVHLPSPLSTVTSSLLGWNGEFGPPSPSASVYTASSQGDIPSSLRSISPHPAFTYVGASQSKETPAFHPTCEPVVGISADGVFCDSFDRGDELSYEDLERAQALEAYAIGLHNYDLFSGPHPFPDYSSMDFPNDDEFATLFPELPGS